jgi:hypothetical protein
LPAADAQSESSVLGLTVASQAAVLSTR